MNEQNTTAGQISQIIHGFALNFLIRKPLLPQQTKKAIILLHGVGSNEQDLFGIANQLPDEYYVISARGQFTLSVGRYAWYNVTFPNGRPVFDASQELLSRKIIAHFVSQLKEHYSLDEVYLGGFSQGAIMSYSIGLTLPEQVKGVFSLGGRILDEIKPLVEQSELLHKLKIFIAHGVHDNTLPIHFAREAKEYLETLGVSLDYHEYNMGHQITQDVLKNLKVWFR